MNPANFVKTIAWSDFTPKDTSPNPPRKARTKADAKTPAHIAFAKNSDGKFVVDQSKFSVTISMNTADSWVVRGSETDALLNHEQAHYNVTALGGRDFLNDALALTADKPDELTSDLQALMTSMQALVKSVNLSYDEDPNCGTDHGNKKDKQDQWDLRIKNAMNSTSDRLSTLASCPASTSTSSSSTP